MAATLFCHESCNLTPISREHIAKAENLLELRTNFHLLRERSAASGACRSRPTTNFTRRLRFASLACHFGKGATGAGGCTVCLFTSFIEVLTNVLNVSSTLYYSPAQGLPTNPQRIREEISIKTSTNKAKLHSVQHWTSCIGQWIANLDFRGAALSGL